MKANIKFLVSDEAISLNLLDGVNTVTDAKKFIDIFRKKISTEFPDKINIKYARIVHTGENISDAFFEFHGKCVDSLGHIIYFLNNNFTVDMTEYCDEYENKLIEALQK